MNTKLIVKNFRQQIIPPNVNATPAIAPPTPSPNTTPVPQQPPSSHQTPTTPSRPEPPPPVERTNPTPPAPGPSGNNNDPKDLLMDSSESLPKYRRDLVAKLKCLRTELHALQPQTGHCRLEVTRKDIFEVSLCLNFDRARFFHTLFLGILPSCDENAPKGYA